ncbi:MAG TPA: hypothetical protein VHK67_01255, partial [Rhabdochlamydiaceae bacterium]|nr:hypothetical protein [Rhabdochlamydiaceae bacterium]
MAVQLNSDVFLRIFQFADRQTLTAFSCISRFFANHERLHERLFGLEHPNLNITEIQPSSWKELRIQRTLAERNLLEAQFQKELIFTLPPEAEDEIVLVLQGRPFIGYTINCTDCIEEETNPPTFFLYDVQKKKTLSFLIPLSFIEPEWDTSFYPEELDGGIYLTIECSHNNQRSFLLIKVDDKKLTEIQRYTTNEPSPTPFKWIFCKKTNSFRLAMTIENRLLISTTETSCNTKNFNRNVCITGHFFWNEHSLLMLQFPDVEPWDKFIFVYDFNTLEHCFTLKTPWLPSKRCSKVVLQDQKLTLFGERTDKACIYKISSFPQKGATYRPSYKFSACAQSLPIYLKNKMRYMTVKPTHQHRLYKVRLSTPHSSELKTFFEFPTPTYLIPCESQG